MKDLTDQDIAAKVQLGANEHFAELYDRYFEKIYRYIFYRINNTQTTEDLVSAVFIKAYQKIDQFNADKGLFSTWIYKVAQNTLVDFWRSNKNKNNVSLTWAEDIPSQDDPEKFAEDSILASNIQNILDQLDGIEKQLIMMRVWDELPYSEISVLLNKSEAAVKMQFSRIIAKLRSSTNIKV